MSLQSGNNLLDLWFEGSHHADPHEYGAAAKSQGATDRDQVKAVVQALQRQQSQATGTSSIPAEPINEVARAFLLSSPKQNARIPPGPMPSARIPPSTIQSARILPAATPNTTGPPNSTQNTEIAPSATQPPRIKANDSLIKARYASTILRVARTSDHETAARLVRAISRDLPLHSEIPEIADIHRRALASFDQLATSLADAPSLKQQPLWKAAQDAVAEWLRAVQSNGDGHSR